MIYVLVPILYLIEPGWVREFIISFVVIVLDLNDLLMIHNLCPFTWIRKVSYVHFVLLCLLPGIWKAIKLLSCNKLIWTHKLVSTILGFPHFIYNLRTADLRERESKWMLIFLAWLSVLWFPILRPSLELYVRDSKTTWETASVIISFLSMMTALR